jgi:hypothetical protein
VLPPARWRDQRRQSARWALCSGPWRGLAQRFLDPRGVHRPADHPALGLAQQAVALQVQNRRRSRGVGGAALLGGMAPLPVLLRPPVLGKRPLDEILRRLGLAVRLGLCEEVLTQTPFLRASWCYLRLCTLGLRGSLLGGGHLPSFPPPRADPAVVGHERSDLGGSQVEPIKPRT